MKVPVYSLPFLVYCTLYPPIFPVLLHVPYFPELPPCLYIFSTRLGEGRAREEILNALPVPKSRSAVLSLACYFAYIFICLMSF